jgi:hypothetical protein
LDFRKPVMLEAAEYSANATLRDGRRISNFRPQDRTIGMTSSRPSAAPAGSRFTAVSLQQSANFSEKEITFFLNVDFVNHVDLVAMTIKQP